MADEIPDSSFDDSLTPEEQAHLDTKGAAEIPAEEARPDAKTEAPAEKPEAEPAEKDVIEGDGKDKVTYVRQEALHEERQRRKAVEKELQAIREERARQEGMLAAMKPQQTAGEKAADAPGELPDIEKDPVGYLKAKAAQEAAERAKTEEQRQLQEKSERVASIGIAHSQEFVKQQPNYFDQKAPDGTVVKGAYTFVREKAAERIAAQYPDATPRQIEQVLNLHELNLIQEAVAKGRNAASMVWEIATEQGYTPPQPKAPEQAKPSEAERIAALEKAQKSSRSLGAVPASGGADALSIEALADMSEEEFAEATKGKAWDKLRREGVLGR